MAKSKLTNQNELILTAIVTVGRNMMFEFVPLQFTYDAIMLQMKFTKLNFNLNKQLKTHKRKVEEKRIFKFWIQTIFLYFLIRSSVFCRRWIPMPVKICIWNVGHAIQRSRYALTIAFRVFRNWREKHRCLLGWSIFWFVSFISFYLVQF